MKIKKTFPKTLSYIGAAINQGQIFQGVQRGPDLIRNSGLFKALMSKYNLQGIKDYGNISLDSFPPDFFSKIQPKQHAVDNLHVLDPLLGKIHQKICQALKEQETQKKQDDLILTVGGDHSISSATISGMLKKYHDLRVVYIGAHPDISNPQYKNIYHQNYHGMVVSHLIGDVKLPGFNWLDDVFLHPRNLVYIAIRDIDPDQWISLKKHNIKCFTMDHVTKYGIGNVLTQSMSYLDSNTEAPFHISFDVSGADAIFAGQTGTVFRDGLDHRQSCHIIRRLTHERCVKSIDICQINDTISIYDSSKKIRPKMRGQQYYGDMTETVGLAVDLIQSVFTKYFTL